MTAYADAENCKDELRDSLQRTFENLTPEEQSAWKAVIQLNKDSLEKLLTFSWEIIAAKLDNSFRTFVKKRNAGLHVNERYRGISLLSVILLPKHHASLGYEKNPDPAYACIRLRKFHEFLDKGAKILLQILYSLAHPQKSKWIDDNLTGNAYYNLKEDVRSKLRSKISILPSAVQDSWKVGSFEQNFKKL